MAARSDDATLRALLNCGASPNLVPFQDMANRLVDSLLVGNTPDALLPDVETLIAAHFYTLSVERGGIIGQTIDDAAEKYADTYKAGFASTRYGQQAIVMDISGTLARESAKADKSPIQEARFTIV